MTLSVINSGATNPPFGDFSTPTEGSTGRSSIPVTGWVLDDIDVVSVKIYNGSDYIGDAIFVDGARPDVEAAFPSYPKNFQAGWGYMLLSNFLPGGGNGSYTLSAIAIDAEGNQVTLGSKNITVANSSAIKPFGAIDTPSQGGNASGSSFINWGWVLTPQPNEIATNGSTIDVWVDGVKIGHPTYNNYRSDIATLFPGYANSNGAVGYRTLNTTSYANGIHTIQWTATDSGGNSDGIGSRYFSILNVSSRIGETSNPTAFRAPLSNWPPDMAIALLDTNTPIQVSRGYRQDVSPKTIYPNKAGVITMEIKEVERVEMHLLPTTKSDGHVTAISPLPIGSSLDSQQGIFYWQPGPGFLGKYQLEFLRWTSSGTPEKVVVEIRINPKY